MVRTTSGQEPFVMEMISLQVKKEELPIYSISQFPAVKGYVFLEADDEHVITRAVSGIPHVKTRGLIAGRSTIESISSMFESKPLMDTIKSGQIVEIIAEPFKGNKAKILRVNKPKEEVTVELLEASVKKIPLTLKAEKIKVLEEGEQ
jgi:transcriptional antiterminator NusG